MLGNFVEETTATVGTGTVALTAATGFARFSDQFGVGALVAYAIQDGSNRETGIGTVASGNTLERTLVLSKLDSGVYSEYPATPLTLSGGAKVFVALERATLQGGFPGLATDAQLYSAHQVISGLQTRALTDGIGETLYVSPFLLTGRARVKALAVHCSTSAAGATTRLGLYAVGTNGLPHRLIVQTSDINASTTGEKIASVPITTLPPGWYYTALANRGGYPAYYAYGTTQNRVATPLGGVWRYGWSPMPAWTELPETAPVPTLNGSGLGDYAVSLVGA